MLFSSLVTSFDKMFVSLNLCAFACFNKILNLFHLLISHYLILWRKFQRSVSY